MPKRPTPTSGAPRWPVLLALLALVLGTHLWLIAGSLPRWAFGPGAMADDHGTAAPPTDPLAPRAQPADAAPARVLPVEVSTVRWILPPTPLAVPTPAPVRQAPTPDPAPAAPAVAAPSANTGTLAEAATPVMPASTEQAMPQDTPAEAVPEPTPMAEITDTAPPATAPALAPTDELVAAAPQVRAPAGTGPLTTAAVPAPSTTLVYNIRGKAKGLSYSADAELRWQNQGSRYSARMEVSAFLLGSRVQTSEGSLGAGGLAPERFGDKRRSAEKAAHFDPTNRRIRFSNNAPDAPWEPGAQDRLSVFLQLGALLQARPNAYPPGSSIDLLVASTGSAEIWRFEVGKAEPLTLPAGSFGAIRLVRLPRREHDSTVEIWLATEHRHLPVRIRVTEADGTQADQQLSEPFPPAAP